MAFRIKIIFFQLIGSPTYELMCAQRQVAHPPQSSQSFVRKRRMFTIGWRLSILANSEETDQKPGEGSTNTSSPISLHLGLCCWAIGLCTIVELLRNTLGGWPVHMSQTHNLCLRPLRVGPLAAAKKSGSADPPTKRGCRLTPFPPRKYLSHWRNQQSGWPADVTLHQC